MDSLTRAPGDTILLGVGGKMGPSLTRMLVRACQSIGDARTITAVSRFSNAATREQLNQLGVKTIAGDLLHEGFIERLPDAANVIHMTGMKFGTRSDASATWAMNTYLPTLVCRRYDASRIAAFSTGNVYPLVPFDGPWSRECDNLGPVGEYAMSALGRERMFEYFCQQLSIPTSLIRLNYSVEMRYGVLVDIAQQVQRGQVIDLSMGYANVIWQGDANAMAIASLADASTPAHVINVAGEELLCVQEVAKRFGSLLDKEPKFTSEPAATALLNDGSVGHQRFGQPRVSLEQMIVWVADWISRDQPTLGKPTHFEVRSGKF
ncbi:MAG: NAD(P)-dependent oxidoreductase [Pirellulaceae bacterium]|nr:NAD(P)-dependent oxidoreductase [Pirellulaceae bacterium]